TFSSPTDMDVESTSTSLPTNKDKTPENIIPPVNKEPLDYDQSFNIAENMLDKNNGNNALHFKRETGAPSFSPSAQQIFSFPINQIKKNTTLFVICLMDHNFFFHWCYS
ncbi:10220_t:CDS:1, partial [Funneliformis geosporum]